MTTLASAYNASRIISYLVIRTSRYADIPLLDMRVHDIDVAVNLRATLPWVPEPPKSEEPLSQINDGTRHGSSLSADLLCSTVLAAVFQHIFAFWTGPWPVLHILLEWFVTELGDTTRIQVGVDLLSSMSIEDMSLFRIMGDGSLPDLNEGIASSNLDVAVGLVFSLALVAITVFEILFRVTGPSIPTLIAGAAAAAAVFLYFYLTVFSIEGALAAGQLTQGEAAAWYYGVLVSILVFLFAGFKISGYFSERTYNWAISRIEKQLGSAQKVILQEATKRLLWAKIFVVVCIALMLGAFIYHAILCL